MNESPGLATGFLLAIVGAFIVARTFIHDANGRNLVDRLVTLAGGDGSSGKRDTTNVLGVKVNTPKQLLKDAVGSAPHGPFPSFKRLLPFSLDHAGPIPLLIPKPPGAPDPVGAIFPGAQGAP